jgi:hypothetical protein
LKAFKKGEKDAEVSRTAPNTPEEENGVTVVANEIDPTQELLAPLNLEQIPSPLRGDLVSDTTKSTDLREEKKEDPPSVGGEKSVDDVVSKTLNFFDDMCAIQQIPQIAADGTAAPLGKKDPQLDSQESSFAGAATYDDNTTSPSLPSETTGNDSSMNPSTQYTSNSYVSSQNKNLNATKAPRSASAAHDHENFEVVLDPASMTKEEKANSSKHKRWKSLSKALSSSSVKKEKSSGSPEPNEPPTATKAESDVAPLLDEVDCLAGNTESEQNPSQAVEEPKSSSGVGGPKVLAKKIWKKIPISTKKQQSHRAEVDSEAAVARSLEASKSTEEQEFLQIGKDVEPILEENESQEDAETGGNDEPEPNDSEEPSSMAKAWNSIFAAAPAPVEPEVSPDVKTSNSEPTPLDSGTPDEQETLQNEEALVPEAQSVEVSSSDDKKTKRTSSLGRRLKKFQATAYFNSSKKKGTKKTKESKASKAESVTATSQSANVVDPEPATGLPRKPKLIWKGVQDPNTGRTYYYHRKTRETTWTKPEAMYRYEEAYKLWYEATAISNASDSLYEKRKEEFKEQGASTAIPRSTSWPKDKNSEETDTQPISSLTEIPIQMSENRTKETKQEDVANGEKETDLEKESAEQKPFDESKPFDEESPFDEPLAEDGPGLLFLPRSPARFGRTMTYTSKASNRSSLTERTEKIKNTGKGKFSSISPINENTPTATSSYNNSYRVPSRVPVYRERQLMVEELTDARLNAESYEGNAGTSRGRIRRGRAREVQPAPEVSYDGDNETFDDYGTSTYDNDTYGTDSVSALSENDTDFLNRRDNFDQARRRALDAAIEIEDWDLAASLSDGMRAVNLPGGYEKAHSSWNQSELDKFIANNDWNAVKSYIARMRVQSKNEQGKGQASSASKRVGSRSQMQHKDVMSESSWSGSDSQSSYDDETYDSRSESEM